MSEQVEPNETLSTPETEQQATEKTTEEQFYGKDQEVAQAEDESKTEVTAESETPEGEEVASSEEEKGEEDSGKEEQEDSSSDWELKLPEDSFVSEEGRKEIEAFAKENKLGKDAAAKILDRENLAVANYVLEQEKQMEAELEGWRNSVVNDADLGGENLKTTVENARRVVEHFGNEEFITLLKDTGYGDNPEVVRFLSGIGKLMSDDSLVIPTSLKENKPIEDYFYPNHN